MVPIRCGPWLLLLRDSILWSVHIGEKKEDRESVGGRSSREKAEEAREKGKPKKNQNSIDGAEERLCFYFLGRWAYPCLWGTSCLSPPRIFPPNPNPRPLIRISALAVPTRIPSVGSMPERLLHPMPSPGRYLLSLPITRNFLGLCSQFRIFPFVCVCMNWFRRRFYRVLWICDAGYLVIQSDDAGDGSFLRNRCFVMTPFPLVEYYYAIISS